MTSPNWTLSVEGFGPIRHAEISLAPFVVMVGRNNTGKSYIASLLWGLLNPSQAIFPGAPVDGPAYQECRKLLRSLETRQKTTVQGQDWMAIGGWINEIISGHSQEIVSSILALPAMTPKKIQIKFSDRPIDVDIEFPRIFYVQGVAQSVPVMYKLGDNKIKISGTTIYRGKNTVDYEIIGFLSDYIMTGRFVGDALYIPAARTGLMLSYKVLVSELLRTLDFGGEKNRGTAVLPKPIVGFLREISLYKGNSSQELCGIAEDLEKKIIDGGIEISKGEINEFWYAPNGSNIRLPIHAVSSLVSELAPFIVLLKSGSIPDTLIFEEPEAHLHLAAQRVLARALVRLVNAGKRVIITTHSDTFLQEVNILLHLHQHPEKDRLIQELGYREDELLNPESAKGYLFEAGKDGTVVKPMEKRREGFVEPVMNEIIGRTTRDVLHIQETDSGLEGA